MQKHGLFRWLLVVVFALSAVGVSGAALAQDGETDDTGDVEDSILVEIEGTIEMLSDDEIVVDGVTVAPANAFDPSMLSLDDEVLVTGYLLNDDTILAMSLELLDDDADEQDDEMDDDGDDDYDQGDDVDDGDDDYDEGEDGEEDVDEEDDLCARDDHPVVEAMVDTYGESLGVTYETLIALHCDGNGLGNIIKVLEAAERAGVTDMAEGEDDEVLDEVEGVGFDEMWALYEEAGNPGQFKNTLAEEYDIHPSDLAPGKALGKKNKQDDGDDDEYGEQDQDAEMQQQGPGNSGNAPGRSGDNPGNRGNGRGQQKDKSNNGNGKGKGKGRGR